MTATVKEAKNRLDELLEKAVQGQDVTIPRDDGTTFKLTASNTRSARKRGGLGSAKGDIWLAEDFEDLPEGFEGYLPE